MAVVGSGQDQGFIGAGCSNSRTHRIGQTNGFIQGTIGVAGMVGVIDAAAFHHQHIALAVA